MFPYEVVNWDKLFNHIEIPDQTLIVLNAPDLENEHGDPHFLSFSRKLWSLPYLMVSYKKVCPWEHFSRERP